MKLLFSLGYCPRGYCGVLDVIMRFYLNTRSHICLGLLFSSYSKPCLLGTLMRGHSVMRGHPVMRGHSDERTPCDEGTL